MELYTLDSLFRRISVFDTFESLIWTERYADTGDFELVTYRTNEALTVLSAGTRLALNESNRVMTIEEIEDKEDSEGRSLLTIKGPSLEDIMSDRTAKGLAAETVDDKGVVTTSQTGKWRIIDTPGNVARRMFKAICMEGILSVNDKIPFIADGNMYPADTIPEITTNITQDTEIGPLYDRIKEVCDGYGLGFRLTRNYDNSQLFFNVYSGSDRTVGQTTRTPVIFSPALENVLGVSYLKSLAEYKNTAYVYHKNAVRVVYASGSDNVSGLSRRVLTVVADDIDLPAGDALNAALDQRGKEELAKSRTLSAIDGEISKTSKYKYGVDYNLGDLVELRDSQGITQHMKVTEQIFVSDSQGDRSYPTLSTDLFINPGSWFSTMGAKVWNDASGTWDSLATA